jgi:hypothetical protein
MKTIKTIKTLSELFKALEDGERVQVLDMAGQWAPLVENLLTLKEARRGVECGHFRIAPKMICITGTGGTFEYPEPVKEPLEEDDWYFLAEFTTNSGIGKFRWRDDNHDHYWLKRNLIHLTKENAKAHYEALIKAMGGVV